MTLKFKDLKIGDRFVWADERPNTPIRNEFGPFVKSGRETFEARNGAVVNVVCRGCLVRKLEAREKA